LKTHSAPPLRYIITDYPYPTLYGTPGKKEAFIHSEIGEFILEAKSQDGSGSCDEKPAHMWECFLVSPYHWIAFFDGPWFGRTERGLRVVDWLRTRIGAHPVQGRAFYVTNGYDEFVALLNRLFQHNAREQNRDARSVDLLSLAGDPSA
jgi:hypothetical protein